MVSSVKSVSSHYDTLKIRPTASNDEISSAFASQLRVAKLHPEIAISRLAQLSVAYETLRDPIKRWAYDVALGLKSEPKIAPPPVRASILGTTLAERLNQVSSGPPARPPQREVERKPEVPDASRVASFIAASLRETVAHEENASPSEAAAERASGPLGEPIPELLPDPDNDSPAPLDDRRSMGRLYASLGAGVLAIGILGAAVVLPRQASERHAGGAPKAAPAITIPLPPAAGIVDSPAATDAVQSPPVAPSHELPSAASIARALQPPSPTPEQDEAASSNAEAIAHEASPAEEGNSQDVASPAETASASVNEGANAASVPGNGTKLPLPDATVARTIERIGYSCGKVISTSSVEGAAAGIYKIVCSSGDSYQATPVHGRYRFRRSGSR
jgi:hypothetical protein